MYISDYDYDLPNELIAKYPLDNRSDSRLMILDCERKEIIDTSFRKFYEYTKSNDLLVFNDTKVINARINGKKDTGGRVEVLIERILTGTQANVFIKASKSPKIGSSLFFPKNYIAEILYKSGATYKVEFSVPINEVISNIGSIPIPPYLNRESKDIDKRRYQTIYAKKYGAVAAPTAGLHFDEEMLNEIRPSSISLAYITLHIGAGTFRPLKQENIDNNQLHSEYFEIEKKTIEAIKQAKNKNGRVIAIGTTSARAIEAHSTVKSVESWKGETEIFIRPGYRFQVVDALLTNFHLPKSSLLMLISALTNKEFIMNAYNYAVEKKYRFYSYGDAMLILPKGVK